MRRSGTCVMPRLDTPDCRLLEDEIIPQLCQECLVTRRALFVGCSWQTEWYENLFASYRVCLITIDADPSKAKHGSAIHHVGSVLDADLYYTPNSFDLVLLNGVIGRGLDTKEDADKAIRKVFLCSRPGATLLVGWDKKPAHAFVCDPGDLPAIRLLYQHHSRVEVPPFMLDAFGTSETIHHVYDTYRKLGA